MTEVSRADLLGLGDIQFNTVNGRIYELDIAALKADLIGISHRDVAQSGFVAELNFPHPDGTRHMYYARENSTLDPALVALFNIHSYDANGTDGAFVKWDITEHGFHAMIRKAGESTIFIDPVIKGNTQYYIVYYKNDFSTDKVMDCSFGGSNVLDNPVTPVNGSAAMFGTCELRTYRLALTATGEYTSFHGGTVAGAQAAQVTTMNRVNGIYEKDLAITMTIIANNNLIIYTNSGTDPFSNGNPGSMISQNQSNTDAVIGNGNYDIGHVFGTNSGGLAGLGVVCSNSSKARGVTGSSAPIGDPFDIDYVAHEIGHQFGGSHTFNGDDGSCATNISNSAAYEPGSGTTIMAYANICGSSNTQAFSDDYFHAYSLSQIISFTTVAGGNSCASQTNTNNEIPIIDTYTNNGFSIPNSTPFELDAQATDTDGDEITYCWEQYDLGPQGTPNSPTGNAPLFRSFSPVTTGVRVFPQMSDIVDKIQTIGEILPNYARSMNFRITIRDNNGGTDNKSMSVSVDGNAGPFEVTSQSTPSLIWNDGEQKTITWDVANTDIAPVSCSTVSIFLSLDGGYTFPITLDSNLPNTGSAIIGVPAIYSANARVKVKGDNNIFFNINSDNIIMNSNCAGIVPTIVTISNNLTVITSTHASNNIWYKNGVEIMGETGQTLTVTGIGTYTSVASISNCESVLSNKIIFTEAMLVAGISDVNTFGVSIFPNPTNSILNINLENLEKNTSIKIKNVIGKTVLSKQNISPNNILNVEALTKGIYFVVISNKQSNYTEKIIIK